MFIWIGRKRKQNTGAGSTALCCFQERLQGGIIMIEMDIRKMRIDDYEKVYDLWMSCSGMGLNDIDDSKEGIRRFLKRNPDTCFVAENQKQIVGVILVGEDGRRGYIYHTAVHPAYRKLDVGTNLVDKALSVLKEKNISKVGLLVFEKNKMGNDFWEKQGFTSRNDVVYRNQTLVEMVRIDT